MSNNSNSINVPEARQAMDSFKMQCANEGSDGKKDDRGLREKHVIIGI